MAEERGPRFLETEYFWERGYAVTTWWDARPDDRAGPLTWVYRVPARGPARRVVWGRWYGDRVTVGGLAEAHEWACQQVRDGLLPASDPFDVSELAMN